LFGRYLEKSSRPGWLGKLGHYEIERILGHGAFGIVAKAFDEKLYRVVAIKMLRPELATTSPPRKRFLREARSAAAVPHENLVGIYAVEDEPIPYLVMEYISGNTLQSLLDQNGPLEVIDVLRIGHQIACGMAAAHAVNLIHRDIKPSNILLSDEANDKAKISDFGLARAVDDASMTASGMIAGTPLYMAPEQARGETLDHRADLFSLGSVLYQMVSGRPPFRASNTIGVLKRVCDDTPRPITDVIPGTPDWLCKIINRLLEKKPIDRFQTAQEVADLLARCQDELRNSGKVTCVDSSIDEPKKHLKQDAWSVSKALARRTFGPVGGVIVAISLIVAAVYFFNRDISERDTRATAPSDESPSSVTQIVEGASSTGWYGWPTDAPLPARAPFNAGQAKAYQERWAKYLGVPVEYENTIGMTFQLVPPGEFQMGSTLGEIGEKLKMVLNDGNLQELIQSEGPQHRVILTQPIYFGTTEVTQTQYARVMGSNPSHYSPTGPGKDIVADIDSEQLPVERVSFNDSAEFCAKLSLLEKRKPFYFRTQDTVVSMDGSGYRLPTEAEWEFACRAGTTTRFWFGDQKSDLIQVGWTLENSGGRTHTVAELRPNPFGLFDMHGNVYEWADDSWDPSFYSKASANTAIDPRCEASPDTPRMCRGGDYYYYDGMHCSSASRSTYPASNWDSGVGFRVVLVLDSRRTPGAATGQP
ncbi:MAG: SUMF1/EgtB/PvdO family nonheme iron enzyme, partial [Planctomycetaceae bacterium]|nr:SUMF1/EgtB/PvdO family nonheme iron enzyme [Planctomycetaceae bacterium]